MCSFGKRVVHLPSTKDTWVFLMSQAIDGPCLNDISWEQTLTFKLWTGGCTRRPCWGRGPNADWWSSFPLPLPPSLQLPALLVSGVYVPFMSSIRHPRFYTYSITFTNYRSWFYYISRRVKVNDYGYLQLQSFMESAQYCRVACFPWAGFIFSGIVYALSDDPIGCSRGWF